MTEEEIKKLVELQRSYFYTGATRPVKTRIEHLKKLMSTKPLEKTLAKAPSKATCAKPVWS